MPGKGSLVVFMLLFGILQLVGLWWSIASELRNPCVQVEFDMNGPHCVARASDHQ
jgi:hypothetical protein